MYPDPTTKGPDPQVFVTKTEFYNEMLSLRKDINTDREKSNDAMLDKLDKAIARGCREDIDELKRDVDKLEENARKSNILSATIGAIALAFVAWWRGG
jgi:hypothetical protein